MRTRTLHRSGRGPGLLGLLLALSVLCPAGMGQATDGPADAAARQLSAANGLLNRGLHELAAKEYRLFLETNANHAKAAVARYGLAVCAYRLGDFEAALKELRSFSGVKGFEFAAEAAAMHGQCLLELGQAGEAADVLALLVREHGDHALADDGAALLVEALYRAERLEDVVRQAEAFTRRWGESALRERVWLFWALAQAGRGEWKGVLERCAACAEAFPDSEARAQMDLLAGQAHERLGELDQAESCLARVAGQAKSPLAADAWLALGGVHLRGGKADAAVQAFDRFLKAAGEHPRMAEGLLLRGRAHYEMQRWPAATADFTRLEQAGDGYADQAAYWLAKCALQQRDHSGAAQRLSAAIERFPKSALLAEMRFDRAVALARAGDNEAAAAALEEFQREHEQHALAADACYLLASTEHQRGRYAQSGAACAAFLKRYPKHDLCPAVAYLAAEGECLQGRHAEAAAAFDGLLRQYPEHPQADDVRYRLGLSLYRLEQYDAALPHLKHAAERVVKQPAYAASLLALGEIYFGKGQWAESEQVLGAYLERAPSAVGKDDALLKLGLCHERQGRREEALRSWQRLMKECPQSPQRWHALFEIGQTLAALERFDEAEQAFARLLKEDEGGRFAPYALNHMGALAQRRGASAEAAEYLRRVAELKTDPALHADALLARGQALLGGRSFAEAEAVFRQFLGEFGTDARRGVARAQLAVALARQERPADALAEIEQVERDGGAQLPETLRDALQYEKAWCLRKLEKKDAAAEAYRALLARNPRAEAAPHALLELAELEAAGGKCDEAVKRLRALREPADAFAKLPGELRGLVLYRLGVCFVELEQFGPASQALDEFLREFGDHALAASASYFCGEAYLRQDQHGKAAPHFQRVADKFENDAVYGPSLLRLGESYAVLQQWERSERVFDTFLRTVKGASQWHQAQFGVGYARENQRRYDEAIAAYAQVIERHQGPTAARAQFQIGECLYAQNKLEQAVAELLKVDILYAYPEWSAAALFEAGRCLEALNKLVEARQQYEAVQKRFGQTRWAELAGQRLASTNGGGLPGKGGSD